MIWYPYQQMKTMQTPYEIVDAEGVYLYTRERRMIDSVSSWWSVIHGYKHPALNQVLVDPAVLRGYQQFAYERGVFSRPFLQYLYAMVPYIIEEEELVTVLRTMKAWFLR